MKKKIHIFATCILLLLSSITVTAQSMIVVQQSENAVAVYDVRKGTVQYHIPTGFKPHEVTCDEETGRCYISDFGVEDYDTRLGVPGRTITIINPFTGQKTGTLYTTSDTLGNMPHGVKTRPRKPELFVNVERKDSMLVFNSITLQLIRKFALPTGAHNFIFSQDGARLWTMCGASGVIEIDPSDGTILHQQKTPSPVRGLTWIGNDLLASCNNELLILSSQDLMIRKHFSGLGVGQLFYSAVTKNQQVIIAPAAYDSTVLLIDARTGVILERIITPKTPLQAEVSGNLAYITHPLDDRITIIDIARKKIAGYLPIKGGNGITIAYKKKKAHR